MYALVDCNNFYASCERVFRPELNGRPVVVLSNNDGCIIARSNEAKALGIEMGALPFEISALMEQHKVVTCSSNYTLYGDMSHRVMTTLQDFSPNIELYSIDESFLDLQHMVGVDLQQHATVLRSTVFRNTGIPVSVGIAPTKVLAKAANRKAKKSGTGVHIIATQRDRLELLAQMEVGDVWGIGHRHAQRLQVHGIRTALDLANANSAWVRGQLSVVGARLQQELRGHPCAELELEAPPKQEICTSRSFPGNITSYGDVEEATMNFVTRCARKLRDQGSAAGMITVFLLTNRFREDLPQHNVSRTVTLPVATNSSIELCRAARWILRRMYRPGYGYKKAGCIVRDLVPEDNVQTALFDRTPREAHRKVMAAMDTTNRRFGRDLVRLGAQGYNRRWRLKAEHLSPAYTTRLKDLMVVRV